MNPESTTLVIARHEEDLEWITEVPPHFKVIVYNKGTLIPSLSALERADAIIPRDNVGRESETYLHHLQTHPDDPNGWTVFCQGDPFGHSPDFLDLLKQQSEWKDVQPLSIQWHEHLSIPPRQLLDCDEDSHIAGLRVRPETFSLYLWSATRFADKGSLAHQEDYLKIHDLAQGTNLAAHFLDLAGLPELAERAAMADCGRFCYGAIFAVRTRLIKSLPQEAVKTLHRLSQGHAVIGYIMERLWMHLFGEPFLGLQQHAAAGDPARGVERAAEAVE